MITPVRIQRRRTKGWRAQPGAVYVGRGTKWGNPARLIRQDMGWGVQWGDNGGLVGSFPEPEARRYAVELYRNWAEKTVGLIPTARIELAGKDLMCWCPLPEPGQPDHCHAAVLLKLANREAP
jgi:hypothetical protein